jgi:serine/threonine protein kinase
MKRGRLTEREASLIVRDIANGLNFMHSKGMSHRFVDAKRKFFLLKIHFGFCFSRDLKPENILVERADSLVSIKLCDFDLGSAIRLNSNKTTPITTPELSTPVNLFNIFIFIQNSFCCLRLVQLNLWHQKLLMHGEVLKVHHKYMINVVIYGPLE